MLDCRQAVKPYYSGSVAMNDGATARDDDSEPDVDTQAAIRQWTDKIEMFEGANEDACKDIRRNRQYVLGTAHADNSPGLVRANLIHSTIASLTPHVYAKDPDVVVEPVEHVEPSGYEVVKKFAKTSELVLKRKVLIEGKLKKRLKSNIRSIYTTGVGWLKLGYQRDIITDPLTKHRINDIQDNLRRADALISRLERSEGQESAKLHRFELLRQREAIQARSEPVHWQGIVIDRVLTEDMLILDDSISDFDDYIEAEALAQGLWMSDDKYHETFGHKPTGRSYTDDKVPERIKKLRDKQKREFRRVYEVWSRTMSCVLTLCPGEKRWCRPPYVPKHLPKRFYPFYATTFFHVDGQWRPNDLCRLMIELQDEYNRARTTYAEHREDALPVRVVREGGSIGPDDVKRIQERKAKDIIVVKGNGNGSPLGHDMGHLPNVPLDPAMYDVSQVRSDMHAVSGMPDAPQGQLIEAKTATEASILQEGLASRSDDMRDNSEDLATEILADALEILLMCLSPQEVHEIAGEGAVWPTMSKEQVFRLVSVKVRGGSTSRPNKQAERQQWVEMLPVLREFVLTINEVMTAGNAQLAGTLVSLLKETLTRFDERLDVSSLVPYAAGEDGMAGMQAQMQVAQMQQAVQALQEQVVQLEAQLADAQAALQDKQADLDMRREQHDRELAFKERAEAAKLDADSQREVLRIEAEIDKTENQLLADRQKQEMDRRSANETKSGNDKLLAAIQETRKAIEEMRSRKRGGQIRRRPDGTPESLVTHDGEELPIATDESGLVTRIG